MKIPAPLIAAALTLCLSSAARAQLSTGFLDPDGSNILNTDEITAINFNYDGSSNTVNGDDFTGQNPTYGTYTGYTLGSAGTSPFTVGDSGEQGSVTSSQAIYPLVTDGFVSFAQNYSAQEPTYLTLTGLTPGASYSVQLLFSSTDDRTASVADVTDSSGPITVEDGYSSNNTDAGSSFVQSPVYALDKFTATGTSEELSINVGPTPTTMTGSYDGNPDDAFDGNQLDFSAFVVDAPEPGTWAMLLLGVGALAWMTILRKRNV